MSLRLQVLSAVRWMTAAKVVGQIFNWAITIFVIRILTPEDYGLMAMVMVLVAFFSLLSESGLGLALVQTKSLDTQQMRQVLGAVIVVNVAIVAILLAIAPLAATFFAEGRLTDLIRVVALQFLVGSLAVIPDSLLRRSMSFKTLALAELVSGVLTQAVTLACALAGLGVWSLVIGTLGGTTVRTVWLLLVSPERIFPRFVFKGLGEFLNFGGKVTLTRIVWYVSTQIDIVIAGRILGKEAVGIYAVAVHLASLPMQRAASIINSVAFPAFARMQDDRPALRENVLLSMRVLALVTIPVFWGISATAPEIVGIFLGQKWLPAVLPMQLMALVIPIRMISSIMSTAIHGIGQAGTALKIDASGLLVLAPSFLIGCQWGLTGLSLSWVFAVPLLFVINLSHTLPALGLRAKEVATTFARPLAAGAVMYGAVLGTRHVVVNLSGLPLMGILVCVGALSYALFTMAVNAGMMREALALLRSGSTGKRP